ncbi:MAG: NAD(P)/FAD-dependent oxidoreductase [Microthrixaceae bacterium]|nr:NAD(P)/FAD-dependent oxidoreductase [Microthrixaceae bacterium]
MTRTTDLIVVGGGAGGLMAAREGLRRGAKTTLIQDGPPGGDCTFTGCVPSKTLLAAGERRDGFSDAMSAVHDTVERIAATEDADTLRQEGIEVITGRARLGPSNSVEVDGTRLSAPRIVIATGSRPSFPPVDGLADASPLTNETLFNLTEQPGRLLILGAGPIGCEMAQAFAALGTRVTLIERADRPLPRDEPEVGAVVRAMLERRGVEVLTGASVTSVARSPGSGEVTAHLDGSGTVEADEVLVATGRTPVTDGLDVGRAGVLLTTNGAIEVDATMATSAPGVWAVGDVTGHAQFTHAAIRMAMVAVANAFRRPLLPRQRFSEAAVPTVTYLDPEVAHVGMTEAQAAAHGGRVAWLPLDELDRALTSGATDGFVKLIAGPRPVIGNLGGGRMLGATIVAPRAGEMIHEVALAMHTKMFAGRLAQAVHAYPTWSMAVQEAAAQFFVEHKGRSARPAQAQSDAGSPTAMAGRR